jgi:trans-aconitate methyltransferase
MQRVVEPELMDEVEQAVAYARADFSEPNERFVALLAELLPGLADGRVVDLGCGPGDIALRLAARWPRAQVDAVDGSAAMLACAAEAAARVPQAAARVRFLQGRLPGTGLPPASYDLLISNSLLHHLHDPGVLWQELRHLGRPGAGVLVMDLQRPEDEAVATTIVATYAGEEPEVLRRDFHASLCAAFTPDEVREQLAAAGLASLAVRTVSDRHLIVHGRLPA